MGNLMTAGQHYQGRNNIIITQNGCTGLQTPGLNQQKLDRAGAQDKLCH